MRHQLQPADYEKQKEFATWFLENQLDNLENVLWTDEAYFHLDETVYTKYAFIWSDSNPHRQVETPIHSPKLYIWLGFSGNIIVPPFFIQTETISVSRGSILESLSKMFNYNRMVRRRT